MNICKSLLALFASAAILQGAGPRIDTPIVSADRNVQLTVHGDAGVEYSVEWSVNLLQWNLVSSGLAVNGTLTVHHDASQYSTIYYRAKTAGADGTVRLYPETLRLNVGGDGGLVALQAAAPLQWSSSDSNIATVDTNGAVKALAKGSANITVTSSAGSATSTVVVYDPTGPAADARSATLIAQAFANSQITPEQDLIYRTYAAFGDARLPAQFQGAPSDIPDDLLLSEIVSRIDTLSPAGQQILRPFLLPPIYAESWYAQQLGLSASAPAARALAAGAVNCSATAMPNYYTRRSTAHFNIYNLKLADSSFDRGTDHLASMVASIIERVYTAETGLLQRFPMSDADEGCNGGDGAIDIYITTISDSGLHGQTVGYRPGCARTPSYIVLNYFSAALLYASSIVSESEGTPLVEAVLAHEFMHVLQLAMDRSGDCDDAVWIDEATAQWAVDFVNTSSNFEDGFVKKGSQFKRTGSFLLGYLLYDHTASIENPGPGAEAKANGYSDYLFFQFLARKFSPAVIKDVFDAMATQRSVEAIQAALGSRGGFKDVWPEFAKTLWNDTGAHLLDFWNTADQYDMGLQYIFSAPAGEIRSLAGDRLKTIEVDQQGAGKAKFTLLKAAARFEGDFEIEPRSFYYEHLKFTDPTVHSAILINPIAAFPNHEFMKLQAWTKIAGQWTGPYDWTEESEKQFCLDKKSERLEELLLLVSNSNPDRGEQASFIIYDEYPMQFSVSNIGCWQWEGDASTQLTGADGTVNTASVAQALFELSTNIPGRLYFEATRGAVVGSQTTPLGPCTITAVGAQRAITKHDIPDARLEYNLDFDLATGYSGDRKIVTLAGSTALTTTTTVACPDFNQTATGDQYWIWLNSGGATNLVVSPDGQTIEGNFTAPAAGGGTQKVFYKFTSKRE